MNVLLALKNIPKVVMKAGGKLVTTLGANKPQILFWGGVGLTLTGFGYAVYNATKLHDHLAQKEAKVDEIENNKKDIERRIQEGNLNEAESTALITQCNKDLKKAKIDAIVDLCKLMGIPCVIFLGGVMLTIGGHKVLLRRFSEISAAFATLQSTFERYRQMNIKEHGEECDRRYRYGIVDETITTAEITDDKGKTKQVKCKVPVIDPDSAASMYSFCFSEDFSCKCPKDPVSTISFLKTQEKYWNLWMETHGKPVTLYMVLNDLGIELDPDDPRNDYIMIAGWRPNGDGDNHIDFGIMRAVNKPAIDMIENVVFLNFNCDGNLYHSTRYRKDGQKVC